VFSMAAQVVEDPASLAKTDVGKAEEFKAAANAAFQGITYFYFCCSTRVWSFLVMCATGAIGRIHCYGMSTLMLRIM